MDREDFMNVVYGELASDPDNCRANRIIDAADEYAESAQLSKDCISRQAAIDVAKNSCFIMRGVRSGRSVTEDAVNATKRIIVDGLHALPPAQLGTNLAEVDTDCISRKSAIDALDKEYRCTERKWTPCSNPPKHHKDVIVRGIEAIGNVTVHKVMQWDVNTWRPTDYAPSVMWKEWSEI